MIPPGFTFLPIYNNGDIPIFQRYPLILTDFVDKQALHDMGLCCWR